MSDDKLGLVCRAKEARDRMNAARAEMETLHRTMLCEIQPRADYAMNVLAGYAELSGTGIEPSTAEAVDFALGLGSTAACLVPPKHGESVAEWFRRAHEHVGDLLRADLHARRR